jgi:hypothetical protein
MSGRVGIVACSSMKAEMELAIAGREVAHLEFLPFGLHSDPAHLRRTIVERCRAIVGEVDAVLVGYGRCQALGGIASEIPMPSVTVEAPDCIGILLTPESYDRERALRPGTWFASPGWKDATAGFIMDGIDWTPFVKELGCDPERIVRSMFDGYTRVLLVDTGAGDVEGCQRVCRRFAGMLSLEYEERRGTLRLLDDAVARAFAAASEASAGTRCVELSART